MKSEAYPPLTSSSPSCRPATPSHPVLFTFSFAPSLSLFLALAFTLSVSRVRFPGERDGTNERYPSPSVPPQERGYNPLTHRAQSKIQAAQAAHSTVDVPSITHRHERRRERRDKKRIRERKKERGKTKKEGRKSTGGIYEAP